MRPPIECAVLIFDQYHLKLALVSIITILNYADLKILILKILDSASKQKLFCLVACH